MKIVMTLMVRDEADIIGAMLEHHFAQGVDHIIATDNASTDGTAQILEEYEKQGLLTLYHDPRHEKQQSEVVTRMAREAARKHDATWVLNADADEFWVAESHSRSLREALAAIPLSYRAFDVPVINMTGDPAYEGSGIARLIYRDQRPLEAINALGLHGHATHNVAFVADPKVEVSQGNHFVNIESHGSPLPGQGIEVLHLPWRSWRQFSAKVRNAGIAYERSDLMPSPNHHGMRDYSRLKQGTLFALYLARHPQISEIAAADPGLLEVDKRLADSIADPSTDVEIDEILRRELSTIARAIIELERPTDADLQEQLRKMTRLRAEALESNSTLAQEIAHALTENDALRRETEALKGSRIFRFAHALGRVLPGRTTP